MIRRDTPPTFWRCVRVDALGATLTTSSPASRSQPGISGLSACLCAEHPERGDSLRHVTLQTTAARPLSLAPVPTSRLTSLDGLRGVAALVVMFHHLYLVAVPSFVAAGGSQPGSVYWWVSQTPLKIFTAGSEAVLVFFVLSGLVVALPALRKSQFSWAGFFSGRIVRIYLPAWASLAIGTALIWLLPRDLGAVTPGAWVTTSNAVSTTPASLLNRMSLTAASYGVNNVLWTLRWELAFSVLLPLFVAVAYLVRRHWMLALCAAFALSLLGLLANIDALRYLPVFFVGTLILLVEGVRFVLRPKDRHRERVDIVAVEFVGIATPDQ